MNKASIQLLTTIIPLIIGLVLIYYQYQSLTDLELTQIIIQFKKAKYGYISLSVFCLLLAHYVRAYRWHYALRFMGFYTQTKNNFLAVLVSYFMNLTIPRSGEISRAAFLYKYEDVSFDKGFGSILTERILDFLIFLLFFLFGFSYNFKLISATFFQDVSFKQVAIIVVITCLAAIIFLRFWRTSQLKIVLVIKAKLQGLLVGMQSIVKMKEKKIYIGLGFVIWALYFLMFILFFWSLEDAENISLNIIVMGFIFGSLAIGLTNGGIGAYPLAVSIVIGLFGVSKEIGVAVGWISWTTQTIATIVFGVVAFLIAPIISPKNKAQY